MDVNVWTHTLVLLLWISSSATAPGGRARRRNTNGKTERDADGPPEPWQINQGNIASRSSDTDLTTGQSARAPRVPSGALGNGTGAIGVLFPPRRTTFPLGRRRAQYAPAMDTFLFPVL
ncbi:hypothetical protein Bbelb_005300 [Branchiostoma belcheri]|nr:hypothetical protein Bbelb_005300 [Branchiostoma belcheri]